MNEIYRFTTTTTVFLAVFRYNSKTKSFEKVVSSTPCDLGDEMKEMMFGPEGGDEEESSDQFTQMALRMGPTAAVVLHTDSKELKVRQN